MAPRRFAEDTTVSVGRSRGEIDDLLRAWKCDAIRWGDDFVRRRTVLEFMWSRPKTEERYLARFVLQMPDDEQLKKHARDGRSGMFSATKYERLKEGVGRSEHRLLVLWLKATFNAVEAGLVEPEAVFLPWLVGGDNRTVAEVVIPRLPMLLGGSAVRLIEGPRAAEVVS